jgi:hypothetical protein
MEVSVRLLFNRNSGMKFTAALPVHCTIRCSLSLKVIKLWYFIHIQLNLVELDFIKKS